MVMSEIHITVSKVPNCTNQCLSTAIQRLQRHTFFLSTSSLVFQMKCLIGLTSTCLWQAHIIYHQRKGKLSGCMMALSFQSTLSANHRATKDLWKMLGILSSYSTRMVKLLKESHIRTRRCCLKMRRLQYLKLSWKTTRQTLEVFLNSRQTCLA